MKKAKVLWVSLFLWCIGSAVQAQESSSYLVKEGNPQAAIFLAKDSGPAVQRAAEELQTYLKKISDAQLEISHDLPGSGVTILLERVPDIPEDLFAHDSFEVIGKDKQLIIRGHSDEAVLYGVYEFLSSLGVRWFMPGEIGENVPKLKDIKIPLGSAKHRPSFRTRTVGLSGYNRTHFDPDNQEQQHLDYDRWLARNRMHFARTIHNIPRTEKHKESYFHQDDFNWAREDSRHNIGAALVGADISTTPERFALVTRDGEAKRRPTSERVQICFTHPDNIQSAVNSALEYFEKNPHFLTFPLALADHYGACECPDCLAANNGIPTNDDPNRLVWTFMNAVADGLVKQMPDKRICFYATYQFMTRPPYDIKASPGVVARTCHVSSQARDITDPTDPRNAAYLDNIRLVKATGAEMASYDYGMFAGNPQPLTILNNVKTYHDLGYVWYGVENMGRDEQRYIVEWVLAQLAWDATQDPQELLESFCLEYYGNAGKSVLSLLNLIEEQVQQIPAITLGNPGTSSLMLTPEVVAKGQELLAQASSAVKGREAERVRRLSDTFEMMSRFAKVARLYYVALDERSEGSKNAAAQEISEFEAFWKEKNIAQICSPRALEKVQEFSPLIDKIVVTPQPVASAALSKATPEELKQAAFSRVGEDTSTRLLEMASYVSVPQQVEEFTLLPELWKFKIDPLDRGESQGWMSPAYEDNDWREISVFNNFERQGYPEYDGVFWYRLKFKAPTFDRSKPRFPRGLKRVWLRIGALDESGDIYVNGKRVLERPLGDWQTSFAVPITLKWGQENTIAIRGLDLYGAGGIWKPVSLYTTS